MLTTILCSFLLVSAPQGNAAPIEAVRVFPDGALIRRESNLAAGQTQYVFRGLPIQLNPASVQLTCEGAEVVSVEVRDRVQLEETSERQEAVRLRVLALREDLRKGRDDQQILESMQAHVSHLVDQARTAHLEEMQSGQARGDLWRERMDWLREHSAALREEKRTLSWRLDELEQKLAQEEGELGRLRSGVGIPVRDVLVDLVDLDGEAGRIALEYIVPGAGWRPVYDMRTAKDLRQAELVHRAQVWQASGEDWADVHLTLSTASPRRGINGPEPEPEWISLAEARRRLATAGYTGRAVQEELLEEEYEDFLHGDDSQDLSMARKQVFASVSDSGLSLDYTLPRRETIESRPEISTVLVGRHTMDIAAEHHVVPEVDTTAWLRARATNDSPWTLLPGKASIYFGADYLGQADLDLVARGEDFTLHLGPDEGLTVEREQLIDEVQEPGIFSSRATLVRSWRIKIKNHGALSATADGSITLVVQEVLPRANDDRISISIEEVKPGLNSSERWQKEREEQGILTWVVKVPADGSRTIELETEIAYPEDLELRWN